MIYPKDSEERVRFIIAFIVLFAFWIFVSSAIDIQHILIGALSAYIISHFSYDLLLQKNEKIPGLRAIPLYVSYLGNLAFEIIKANIQVARIVLDPRLPISPSIVEFKTILKSETAKASLANSITLTPGTLTIDVVGDKFIVHALTKEDGEEVLDWHMEKKLFEVENAS
jgi:multicomponent Na+:H+ antiporter subunit E